MIRLKLAAPGASGPAWAYALVALAFLASRVVYRSALGVRFDTAPVSFFIQYINPWFMQHDLLRSLLYLHHQAPLQNALVGIPVRLFGTGVAFHIVHWVYLACGLATALGILHALLRLGAQAGVAAALGVVYTVSPTTVLYENWLMYHAPVACLLVLSLVALLRFLRRGTVASGLLFFALVGTAALFRSIFGPLFIVLVAVPLLFRPPPLAAGRSPRATVARAAAVPLLVVALNAWKPSVLIGHPYGEALLWCNLAMKVDTELPRATRDELIRAGAISPALRSFCAGDVESFGPLRIPHEPTGVPLLDLERPPDGGAWNAHALEHVLIARRYYKPDALYLLSHYPGAYARAVWHAFARSYLSSSTSDYWAARSRNYAQLRTLDEAVKTACGRGAGGRLLVLVIGLPLTAAYGFWRLVRDRSPAAQAIAFMMLTILYVTAVTTLVSFGDFSRYRYDIDPFYLILFGLLLSDLTKPAGIA
jgi:hypothetical protein